MKETKKMNKLLWRRYLSAILFLTPGIVFTAWLRYYPIFRSFYISLFDYDPINVPGNFIGLDNYLNIFTTSYYWEAWRNTFIFLGLNLLLVFFIPILQAIFLNELRIGSKTFTTIYLVTALIPISVNVILWKWIWHPDYGLANQIFTFFGGDAQVWLSNPQLTKFCIIFPGIIGGGAAVLLYLAAIRSIPSEIYECCKIDGGTGWKKVWYITLPNIKFLIVIQLVMTVISTMQILDVPYQYVSGGPSGASTSMGIYIFKTFSQDLLYGKASAASVVLFFVIGIMTMLQMKLDNSEAS